jgi:hypothetical protein
MLFSWFSGNYVISPISSKKLLGFFYKIVAPLRSISYNYKNSTWWDICLKTLRAGLD